MIGFNSPRHSFGSLPRTPKCSERNWDLSYFFMRAWCPFLEGLKAGQLKRQQGIPRLWRASKTCVTSPTGVQNVCHEPQGNLHGIYWYINKHMREGTTWCGH